MAASVINDQDPDSPPPLISNPPANETHADLSPFLHSSSYSSTLSTRPTSAYLRRWDSRISSALPPRSAWIACWQVGDGWASCRGQGVPAALAASDHTCCSLPPPPQPTPLTFSKQVDVEHGCCCAGGVLLFVGLKECTHDKRARFDSFVPSAVASRASASALLQRCKQRRPCCCPPQTSPTPQPHSHCTRVKNGPSIQHTKSAVTKNHPTDPPSSNRPPPQPQPPPPRPNPRAPQHPAP